MSMTSAEVLDALFEHPHHPLRPEISEWVRNDRRFRTFAENYHGKIRRKLRNTTDAANVADLRFELEIARWLLGESRFEVKYETFDARQGGPDYQVAYRVNTRFNVEVRRIRTLETGEARVRKLVETVTDKTRQMPPASINLLVIGDGGMLEDELTEAGVVLRGLAERKVEDYFTQRGYKNAADFLRQYRHLSGVAFKGAGGKVWLNPLAKHLLPKELTLVFQRLLG